LQYLRAHFNAFDPSSMESVFPLILGLSTVHPKKKVSSSRDLPLEVGVRYEYIFVTSSLQLWYRSDGLLIVFSVCLVMARPSKCRWIYCEPAVTMFKPRGIPATSLETVTLGVDELEALRLKDLEGLEQEEVAVKMNVSQPTLHRMLESAHKKTADSLVHGKALVIEGGNYEMREGERLFKCYGCQNEWQEPYGTGRPDECPKCQSTNIHRAPEDRGYARRHGGRGGRCRHGQN